MDTQPENSAADTGPAGPPRPLDRLERRVLGVLAEKAKTTPEAYPLSLNALTTACNQKSNRDPQMNLQPEEVEETLERLRGLGAVAEVQGGGRVARYRHYLYEFLAVDRVELAVMAELLLRGAQTVGELRGRAARMEPIADLAALVPVLEGLVQKGLVLPLSPAGRGQIVTHNLYRPEELEKVRRKAGLSGAGSFPLTGGGEMPGGSGAPTGASSQHREDDWEADETYLSARAASGPRSGVAPDWAADLRQQLDDLRSEVATIRRDLEDLRMQLGN